VRLTAANINGALKPGLFGSATFEIAGNNALSVPRDAVVDTGRKQHVFVLQGDRFEPRTVTVGAQLAERVEIRDGLIEGEQVVVAGVFLLDSESRLRATGGAGTHQHGSPGEKSAPTSATDSHAGHKG
jgi:Cu(I)/Ag(I) efflux system membrane fusion protein